MARFVTSRNNFVMGEVSPAYYGRNDIDQYKQMCEEIKNYIVRPQGGVIRRPGTMAVIDDADLSGCTEVKLIPFYANKSMKYIIWFGYDGTTPKSGYFTVPNTAGGITVGSSTALDTYDGTAYFGEKGHLNEMQYTQYGNLLVVVNRKSLPVVIYADENTPPSTLSWGWAEIVPVLGGTATLAYNNIWKYFAWEPENITATTITSTVVAGSIVNLVASAALFTADMEGGDFPASGTVFRLRVGAGCGLVSVDTVTDSTHATGKIMSTLPAADGYAYQYWSENSWSTRRGFPGAASFFNGRLCFAGTDSDPDRVWFSKLNNIYEFSPVDPTAATDINSSYDFTPIAEASSISWITPQIDLLIGTETACSRVDTLDSTLSIGNGNTSIKEQFHEGFTRVSPARVQSCLIGIDRNGKKLKEIEFEYRKQGYLSTDLSRMSSHMLRDRSGADLGVSPSDGYFAEICYQQEPNNVVWCRTESGVLIGLTRNKVSDTLAWHHHEIGGDGVVLAIASIQGTFGDQLHMAVRRTINGSAKTIIEFFEEDSQSLAMYDSSYANAVASYGNHLDCAGYSKKTANVSHTFSHLPSTEVSVVADGIYVGEKTTDGSGVLTLDVAAAVVWAGFNYTSKLVPLALESNSLFGNGLGQVKRVDEVTVLFDRSIGAKISTKTGIDSPDEVVFAEAEVPTDPKPFFTGEKTLKFSATYERQQQIVVQQDEPYPCSINAVISKGVLYD